MIARLSLWQVDYMHVHLLKGLLCRSISSALDGLGTLVTFRRMRFGSLGPRITGASSLLSASSLLLMTSRIKESMYWYVFGGTFIGAVLQLPNESYVYRVRLWDFQRRSTPILYFIIIIKMPFLFPIDIVNICYK